MCERQNLGKYKILFTKIWLGEGFLNEIQKILVTKKKLGKSDYVKSNNLFPSKISSKGPQASHNVGDIIFNTYN